METSRTSLTLQEVAAIKKQATAGRSYSDRISFQLAIRLLGFLGERPDSLAVLDELDYLEGIRSTSRTKQAEKFRKPPLHSLWHKHFHTSRHIMRNIGDRWGISRSDNGSRKLTGMINEVAKEYGDESDLWPKMAANKFVIEGYQDRIARGKFPDGWLTGDWIVFCKHEGKNYYLDLASHKEGRYPQKLIEKLKRGCAFEFSFAFINGRESI